MLNSESTMTAVWASVGRLDEAADRMGAAIGAHAVIRDEVGLREFHDPYARSDGSGPSIVVQPATVDEVRAVLAIATDMSVPVWTSSVGRNYGYGGAAPVVDDSIALNLRRMDAILEIDEEAAFAIVEPGVTFFALYAEIKRRGLKLTMSVPDLGWGSVIGNALEHGYGYTVNGDNAAAIAGLEVVLADGDVVRTGLAGVGEGALWGRHKRGFGPSLDSMFMQSNFGVVTKAALWLMPEPDAITTGSIVCHSEAGIGAMIDTLRPLVLDGTIQGYPLIVSSPEPPDGRATPFDDTTTGSQLRRLSATLPPGRWDARVSFYGHESVVRAREAVVRAAFESVPDIEIELRSYVGGVSEDVVHPLDLVPVGIPNMYLLDVIEKHFGHRVGHVDFSPAIPFTGAAAADHEAMVQKVLRDHGLVAAFAWVANSRSLVGACMVLFDRDDEGQTEAAYRAVAEMCRLAAERGWVEYRAHPAFLEQVVAEFDFNDHASRRLSTRLKDALDPAGILSPGNHGIWPSLGAPAPSADERKAH
jgi:4-cresol dehydrogenase (hydroxylating)